MRLSWNEIRARASDFSREWADAKYEKGETQSFYNDFFEVFGVKRRRVASYEEPVKLLGDKRGFIDLFWKGVLLVEQKSAGRNRQKAKTQALEYFPGLKEIELPRYILISDFQTFDLYDLDEGDAISFKLSDLSANVDRFGFIIGVEKRSFKDQDEANIDASEIMGRLHDALKASRYVGHDLERLLVRLVFCLFADATGIFDQRGQFLDLIQQRTSEDGADTGRMIIELFEVLNKDLPLRQKTLDDDLAAFPYVNGGLFEERLPTPAFNTEMRKLLIEAAEFKWDVISPAIFGSLFQSVMKKAERRASGAHYTTEKNIMKVIQPLFLDDLQIEFEKLKCNRGTRRNAELRAFHDRLSRVTFFDPACGCGNFLIIAYRELRLLEIELLRELNPRGQRVLDIRGLSRIDVNQFYGIEIGEFAARIAETALWMMDHIMNVRLSIEFGESFARIPLKASPHIHCADALEIDWGKVISPSKCSFVFGNPPFIGSKYQDANQRNQMATIAGFGGTAGTLDYVAAWFIKAAAYIQKSSTRIGFVATSSITQGEQVAQLWPELFDHYGLEIAFAHRTFAWGSDARGVAHVHVVILGLSKKDAVSKDRRLFSYDDVKSDPVESVVKQISPYLVEGGHTIIFGSKRPLNAPQPLVNGNVAADGGNLVFDLARRDEIVASDPNAAKFIRSFVGGDDLVNGYERFCLWIKDSDLTEVRKIKPIVAAIKLVRAMREISKKQATVDKSAIAYRFTEVRQPSQGSYLAIPRTSSERRDYLPIAFFDHKIIAANDLQMVPDAGLFEFSILTSRMHMAWTRITAGRLKSDIRYSALYSYNTFPWPSVNESTKAKIAALGETIIRIRAAHTDATLADLYDPDVMPGDLRKAHRALDAAVDKLYRSTSFSGDRERVEHLFSLYEKATLPLVAPVAAAPGNKRKVKA